MAFSVLRSIYREGAPRSFHWIYRNFCRWSAPISTTTVSGGVSDEPSRRSISPWLMIPPTFEGGDMVYNFYSLAEDKVISVGKRGGGGEGEGELPDDDTTLVGSSHGWLALYNERNMDLFLSNPLSRRHIKLPPIQSIPIPQIKLTDWRRPLKLIVSCSPDDDDCRAIMCFGAHSRMAFCCPSRSTEWTPIGSLFHENEPINEILKGNSKLVPRCYEDFVYSSTHKRLFCVTQFSDLEAWDLGDPQSPRMNWKMNGYDNEKYYRWPAKSDQEFMVKYQCSEQNYLVFAELSNQLFLVVRYINSSMGPDGSYVQPTYRGPYKGFDARRRYKTIDFDVHKIDREKGELINYMDGSLDGLAMFIGINHGFALSAADDINLKPNSIYFTDDKKFTPPPWGKVEEYGGHDVGIFHYEDKTFSPCYYPCDIKSVKRIMWFTPS